jgi:hypothetical protein
VAQAVVDDLEAVEVEEEHARRAGLALGPGHGHGQAVEEERAVGQAGEGIVGGGVGQLGLGLLAGRDLGLGRLVQAGVVEGDGGVGGDAEQHAFARLGEGTVGGPPAEQGAEHLTMAGAHRHGQHLVGAGRPVAPEDAVEGRSGETLAVRGLPR